MEIFILLQTYIFSLFLGLDEEGLSLETSSTIEHSSLLGERVLDLDEPELSEEEEELDSELLLLRYFLSAFLSWERPWAFLGDLKEYYFYICVKVRTNEIKSDRFLVFFGLGSALDLPEERLLMLSVEDIFLAFFPSESFALLDFFASGLWLLRPLWEDFLDRDGGVRMGSSSSWNGLPLGPPPPPPPDWSSSSSSGLLRFSEVSC